MIPHKQLAARVAALEAANPEAGDRIRAIVLVPVAPGPAKDRGRDCIGLLSAGPVAPGCRITRRPGETLDGLSGRAEACATGNRVGLWSEIYRGDTSESAERFEAAAEVA